MNPKNMKAFTPLTINGMTLKNRLGFAPFGSHPAAADGCPNEKTLRCYEPIAKGGFGLINMGISLVTPSKVDWSASFNAGGLGMPSLNRDEVIPAWKRVNETLQSYGCKTSIQLGVFGNQNLTPMSDIAPDNKKYEYYTVALKNELPGPYSPRTKEDLHQVIKDVAAAAGRAKKGGFSSVQIHAAHTSGLLFAGSLDPFFNIRDDEYGGSPENRLRLILEVVKAVREEVGPDFPVTIRLNGDDLKGELGNTVEDVCRDYIPALEAAGIDAFDISAGGPLYSMEGPEPPMYLPRGCWIHLAAEAKKHTSLPVFGVGRITTVEMAEKYLQDESADLIMIGRQGMAQPDFINNYLAGQTRPENVRQCIGCLHTGCIPCAVNYEREDVRDSRREYAGISIAEQPKKVMVVGGGVGGMEAARIAALRGHKVTLYEKSGTLGGTVGILSHTKLTSEFKNITDYLMAQMTEQKVDVRVCREVTAELVRQEKPDAVILASGATLVLPEQVKGAPMVMTHLDAIERRREFRSYGQWKKKVLIYGFTASEFAIDLAEEGADVILMGPGGEASLCSEGYMGRERKYFLRRKLTDINYIRRSPEQLRVYNPKILYHTKLVGVTPHGVEINYHGGNRILPYDVLIVSMAKKKNDELYDQIKDLVPEVYKIGDCDRLGNIHAAIVSANEAASQI